ncbi:MAG: 50S ribosomal protein L4 [Verrucomicrobiota bacterium]|nr:50S ribosomal protein L4 [Verrucomicrobiota bacterium]
MKLTVKNLKDNSQQEIDFQFPLVEGGKGNQAVHDTVVAYMAAQRSGTACTKTMGDVAGTGKKPWRQKGTGRARAGSFASPLWRGGGVVFGPKPRDFSKKVSKTTRQLALRKALTERLQAGDVLVIEEIKLENPKTKTFINVLDSLDIVGTTLLVSSERDENLSLASRNVWNFELTTSEDLNTYQVLRYDKLVFTRGALEKVKSRLSSNEQA